MRKGGIRGLPLALRDKAYYEEKPNQQHERDELERKVEKLEEKVEVMYRSLRMLDSTVHNAIDRIERQQRQPNQEVIGIFRQLQHQVDQQGQSDQKVIGVIQQLQHQVNEQRQLNQEVIGAFHQLQYAINQMVSQNAIQAPRKAEPSKTEEVEPTDIEKAKAILKNNLL